jgi:Arc/MetJ-type ribon-helix-helix transcriptional regulator
MSELSAALITGEESGTPEPFDFDAFIEAKKAQLSVASNDQAAPRSPRPRVPY